MTDTSPALEEPDRAIAPPYRRGRWVVTAMFLFAAVLTATMWIYWRMHIGPFLPLQRKLVEEWPDSRPRVQGGQRKMHRDTPRILQVTMYIDFDPTSSTGKARAKQFSERVASFVVAHEPTLPEYEVLEIRMLWEEREKAIKRAQVYYAVGELTRSDSKSRRRPNRGH